jgi:hypothetical protein
VLMQAHPRPTANQARLQNHHWETISDPYQIMWNLPKLCQRQISDVSCAKNASRCPKNARSNRPSTF